MTHLGVIYEKTGGQKCHWTVPLNLPFFIYCTVTAYIFELSQGLVQKSLRSAKTYIRNLFYYCWNAMLTRIKGPFLGPQYIEFILS